jgi:hypothetical protein
VSNVSPFAAVLEDASSFLNINHLLEKGREDIPEQRPREKEKEIERSRERNKRRKRGGVSQEMSCVGPVSPLSSLVS